jgi:hypothetical protein
MPKGWICREAVRHQSFFIYSSTVKNVAFKRQFGFQETAQFAPLNIPARPTPLGSEPFLVVSRPIPQREFSKAREQVKA